MQHQASQTTRFSQHKKPSVILHIGMHKTGSTSLQRFFLLNRFWLRLAVIDYPKAYGFNGRQLSKHNNLFHAVSHEKDFNSAHPFFGPSSALVEDLKKLLKPGRILLLSAEGFSGEDSAFAKAFEPLQALAEVRVVCFLRRQDDWVESLYKQMVISREVRQTMRFDSFLDHVSTRKHLNYLQILDWWADIFGVAAVKALIYPPSQGLVPTFLEAAGLPPALRFLPFSNSVQNLGQTSGFIERVRLANDAGLPKPEPSSLDTNLPLFAPEDRRIFMQSYENINEAIRAKYRNDLKCLFNTQ